MASRNGIVLAVSFGVSFLAVGVPYWSIPYAKASLPSSLYSFGLLVIAAAAATSRFVAPIRLRLATAVIGASAPCAVLARVAYETSADPTSHNLWPFELVIASAVGLAAALGGTLLGSVLVSAGRGFRPDRGAP
jgi:hypothetical protein